VIEGDQYHQHSRTHQMLTLLVMYFGHSKLFANGHNRQLTGESEKNKSM